ncbi:MAG: homoserine O-acetyltransferase [Rickettsiales bacterium]|nr:homoserine O-acetyltransferase [Pseudomonadota bacterium]MDA0967023.1 homoserine O-acetyltransferase [Pseudomonadota bacterium]MDG4543943.1 homoserine O-acetyltransferase [Rickettsiales bacterium]MDG4546089.1 homoserine O-acetyltransferase [Rickettsiales bacterium]MDG4548335.1 homoserine O-acetyltransferase [Rickettsiales bacterium]
MSKKVKEIFGPEYKEFEIGDIIYLAEEEPLMLDCGKEISNFPIAYQTAGKLNKNKSNAILLCHGLTGDQYFMRTHPVTGKPGWWEEIVGKGKLIDTDKYFVICANVLGGCMGSYGPKHINPETNKPYGLDFPIITIGDMVRSQKLLIEHLGIKKLAAVIGGSMGGMLALEWAVSHGKMVYSAAIIASASRHTAQNIAFHEIGRQTIMADPNWCEGKYIEEKKYPVAGLSVARMTAHVTYLSEHGLQRKFDRGLQDREAVTYGFDADFQVESYLRYQGRSFVDRFDPNSYLYITRAMDYFDLVDANGGNLSKAFKNVDTKFCIISFSSDWLFPTSEAKNIVHALSAAAAKVSFVEVETDKGHDAFLLDEPEFFETLGGFVNGITEELGI